MRRAARPAGIAVLAVASTLFVSQSPSGPPRADSLPALGTELGEFPAGAAKAVAVEACLNCHSADLVAQQRLTEKQWAAEVDKMVRWGAAVPEDKKETLVAYLLKHFGPDNDRFRPVVAQPANR